MTLHALMTQLTELLEAHPEYADYMVGQRYDTCCTADLGTIEKIDEKKQMIYLGESGEE